ncbi:MAG: RluA family pseudouridine synthase [Bdellovibrionales bacterium]|nr:RluA family pseudouridine synthase [Bdellovibrionales bacterium]
MTSLANENAEDVAVEWVVDDRLASKRADAALTGALEDVREHGEDCGQDLLSWFCVNAVSRAKVQEWIRSGRVSLDGEVMTRPASRLPLGGRVRLLLPQEEPFRLEPDASIPLDIVYEDDVILVVNKQPGLVVHPGAGVKEKTLVHALRAHLGESFSAVGAPSRPGLVHRLDKDTSGLLVVAKTSRALQHLVDQFHARTVRRQYLALVGRMPRGSGTIEGPIGRHPKNRKMMAVVPEGGKPAVTHWMAEEALRWGFLLRVSLESGRTHQIRVHLLAAGAPVLGDPVYGSPQTSGVPASLFGVLRRFGRQALHAADLELIHPVSGELCRWSAPLPSDMVELLMVLRNEKVVDTTVSDDG